MPSFSIAKFLTYVQKKNKTILQVYMANLISLTENCPFSCVAYLIAFTVQKYSHFSLNER